MKLSLEKYNSNGELNLFNNPIENPPIAIIEQGNQAVIDYFEEIEAKGKDYLFEAKVLVLGESGAGKTTFSKKYKTIRQPYPKTKTRQKASTSLHGILT